MLDETNHLPKCLFNNRKIDVRSPIPAVCPCCCVFLYTSLRASLFEYYCSVLHFGHIRPSLLRGILVFGAVLTISQSGFVMASN